MSYKCSSQKLLMLAALALLLKACTSAALAQDSSAAKSPEKPKSPIFEAARSGDTALIDSLLEKDPSLVGAKDTATDASPLGNGFTPLHWAAFEGHRGVMMALIRSKANVNATDAYGYRPLHFAKNARTAEFLLANGADINAKSTANGWTPLHRAAFSGKGDLVEFLLAKGAAIMEQDHLGNTPLHYAAGWCRHVDVSKALLEAGAKLNARDYVGWTPLHHAAFSGNVELVKLFLERGAQVNAKDNFGDTPLSLAEHMNQHEVAKALRAAGGNP